MDNKSYFIEAPLSGTFYISPSPDEPPFVQVGQEVKDGEVMCIVESMKVFTEIRSERNGVVRQFLIENEDPVAINQKLIELEPL